MTRISNTSDEAFAPPQAAHLEKVTFPQQRRQENKLFFCGGVPYQNFCMLLLCFLAAMDPSSAQTDNKIPPVEKIVASMVQARVENQARFRPYIVTRDYRLFGDAGSQPKSRVLADLTFTPPTSKNYTIRDSWGAGMGEGIVRRMLAGEAALADDQSSDLTMDNYDFRLVGEDQLPDGHCFVIEVNPKRKQKSLIKGKIWVDSQTYLPRRLEGEPAKKPSWWVKDLHIKLFYGDVDGMWLQTGLEATADVRIVGQCKMVSRDVEYSFGEMAASRRPPRHRRAIPGSNAMFGFTD